MGVTKGVLRSEVSCASAIAESSASAAHSICAKTGFDEGRDLTESDVMRLVGGIGRESIGSYHLRMGERGSGD